MPKFANARHVRAALPRPWQKELGDAHLETVAKGEGAASVFRIIRRGEAGRDLKLATGRAAKPLGEGSERRAWLGERGVRVPRVLRAHATARQAAVILSAMPGLPPHACGRPAGEVVAAIARTFAALHALPAETCS